ncbi:MAG: hypothetical protein HOV79_14840 [Hamadaea sp.]|nr:hypothetical protein [Hamadaea sp.]
MNSSGPVLFARYAYPPNALGYCGPEDAPALLEYADAAVADAGLIDLARRFEGAWPYLALIAAAAGIADPLDRRVVEAYWLGAPLVDRVPPGLLAVHVEERFRPRRRGIAEDVALAGAFGSRPHHQFHVFAVYPWVGMLRAGYTVEPLRVLDSCRIRWGTVVSVCGPDAVIACRPLVWTGRSLSLGPPQAQTLRLNAAGRRLAPEVHPGDVVSAHWDWVCDVLTARQKTWLARSTAEQLRRIAAAPAVAASVCG